MFSGENKDGTPTNETNPDGIESPKKRTQKSIERLTTSGETGYVADIFARANIQQLRSFLLSGTEVSEIESKSYSERIRETETELDRFLAEKIPDKKIREMVAEGISEYAFKMEEIHIEIGVISGIKSVIQIPEE